MRSGINMDSRITQALDAYDKYYVFTEWFLKNYDHISNDISGNSRRSFVFKNKATDEKVTFDVEMIGVRIVSVDNEVVWHWSWDYPLKYPQESFLSKEILNYGLELGPDNYFSRKLLVTSQSKITTQLQMDIRLAIITAIMRTKIIFGHKLELEGDIHGMRLVERCYACINNPQVNKLYEDYASREI